MTKKQILWLLLFLLLLILIIWYKCCRPDSPKVSNHVPNQLIVNFNGNNLSGFKNDVNRLGYKIKATCPCSDSLILLEDTLGRVDLNPDGNVKGSIKDYGGDGTQVSRNYTFDQGSFEGYKGRLGQPIENPNTNNRDGIFRYPKPINPVSTVIVSTVDSGVDTANFQLKSRLFRNATNSTYCGTTNLEGIYGLNIPFVMGRATAGETVEPKDNNGHGTFINGIIAGVATVDTSDQNLVNLFTGGGDNHNVAIQQLNVSFSSSNASSGTLFDALCGIHYSLKKGAKVINASWGLVTYGDSIKEVAIFKPTLEAIVQSDAVLVVSAGNDSINFDTDADRRLAWPAAFSRPRTIANMPFDYSKNVITVGAWNLQNGGNIAYFSNRGSLVDVYAPGFNILSLERNATSKYVKDRLNNKGTSFAAPFIARTAAILRGLKISKTAADIKQAIVGSSVTSPTNGTVHLVRHNNALAQ